MCIKFAVRSAFAVALFAVGLAVTTPARADVEVGILSCRSFGATSYIIVSDQSFNCIFTPSAGGPVQYYQATLHRVGAQVGFSDGPNWPYMWARAADLVDKILHGAKPADIPVEQPTKFDFPGMV